MNIVWINAKTDNRNLQRWFFFGLSAFRWSVLLFCFLGGEVQWVRACENPVYQYAIQRWKSTPYELLAFESPQENSSSEIESLKEQLLARSTEGTGDTNYHVVTSPEVTTALWQKLGKPLQTSMVILMPLERPIKKCVFWQGELTESNVRLLLDSPSRQAICEELLNGAATIWLMLNSGDPEKDKAAMATLEESIEKFKIHYTETEVDEVPRIAVRSLDRDDPNEMIFVSILSNIEPGLDAESDKPIAIPIYGRGRALYALVGDGINAVNVAEACKFITGPCACDAKDDNPGVDLLIACRWDEELERRQTFGDSEETPIDQPLVGLSSLAAEKAATQEIPPSPSRAPLPTSREQTQDPSPWQLPFVLFATLVAAATGLGVLTVTITRRKQP